MSLCRERSRSRGLRADRTSGSTAVRSNAFFLYINGARKGNRRFPCAFLPQAFVTLRYIINTRGSFARGRLSLLTHQAFACATN